MLKFFLPVERPAAKRPRISAVRFNRLLGGAPSQLWAIPTRLS